MPSPANTVHPSLLLLLSLEQVLSLKDGIKWCLEDVRIAFTEMATPSLDEEEEEEEMGEGLSIGGGAVRTMEVLSLLAESSTSRLRLFHCPERRLSEVDFGGGTL